MCCDQDVSVHFVDASGHRQRVTIHSISSLDCTTCKWGPCEHGWPDLSRASALISLPRPSCLHLRHVHQLDNLGHVCAETEAEAAKRRGQEDSADVKGAIRHFLEQVRSQC